MAWWEPGEKLGGGVSDLADCRLEGGLGTRGGCLHSTDLAHVLARGSLDLLGGGPRFQPAQRGDVATHGGAEYRRLHVTGGATGSVPQVETWRRAREASHDGRG